MALHFCLLVRQFIILHFQAGGGRAECETQRAGGAGEGRGAALPAAAPRPPRAHLWYWACRNWNSSLIRSQDSATVNLKPGWPGWCGACGERRSAPGNPRVAEGRGQRDSPGAGPGGTWQGWGAVTGASRAVPRYGDRDVRCCPPATERSRRGRELNKETRGKSVRGAEEGGRGGEGGAGPAGPARCEPPPTPRKSPHRRGGAARPRSPAQPR